MNPHVALEVEGVMEAFATVAAHVAAHWAVALEMARQHALQWEGLGAEGAAKCPCAPGSGSQSTLRGLWGGTGVKGRVGQAIGLYPESRGYSQVRSLS